MVNEIQKLLDEYGDEVMDILNEVVPKVSKEAVKRLKKTSPVRTGKYSKGWTSTVEKGRTSVSGVVYGKKGTYNIAHLLEHGHARRGGGRDVEGIEHIKPVEKWAADEIVKEVTERIT